MGVRVIVCGSRDWTDRKAVFQELDEIVMGMGYDSPKMTVVHGACRGADLFAAEWAKLTNALDEPHPANWDNEGPRAGPWRNQRMAEAGADLCLAFWTGSSRGTLDMITTATKAGIPVRIIPKGKP